MTFANPMALTLLLLAGPIVALYLLRQRRRPVQVASLLFWDDLLSERRSAFARTHLRRWLSLLAQLLFLLLVALAAAQPGCTGTLGGQRIVIFLDTSATMLVEEADGTRWEAAVREADAIIAAVSMADSAMLVSVGREPHTAARWTSSRRTLREALRGLSPTHGVADFDRALGLLANLPEDERPLTAVVISDGVMPPIASPLPENLRLAYVPVGEAAANVGITAFSARPLPGSIEDFEIWMQVANHSPGERVVPYDLRVQDRLIDAGELRLAPGEVATRTTRHLTRTGGVVTARIEPGDAFSIDDEAFALLPPAEPVRVLLVRGDQPFVERALATDSQVAVTAVGAPPGAAAIAAADYEVVVFDGVMPQEPPPIHALFVGVVPNRDGLVSDGVLTAPLITEWERAHPVMRGLTLGNVTVDQAARITAHEGYSVLVDSPGGPLVLARTDAEAGEVLIGFRPMASDLPLRAAFPIVISNAVRYLARGSQDAFRPADAAGSLITREELAARLTPGQQALLPSEDAWQIAGSAAGGSAPALLARGDTFALDRVGVYLAAAAGSDAPTPVAAVNLADPRSSDIAPADTLPLMHPHEALVAPPARRVGLDPLAALIVLALGLSIGEWFLYHRRWLE